MSTFEATVSMLETLPEDAKILVYQYTRKLYSARKPASPFTPLTEEQLLADLAESRQEAAEGKCIDMKSALLKTGEEHGFI